MAANLEMLKKQRVPHRRLATTSINASKTIISEVGRDDYVPVLKGHLSVDVEIRTALATHEVPVHERPEKNTKLHVYEELTMAPYKNLKAIINP